MTERKSQEERIKGCNDAKQLMAATVPTGTVSLSPYTSLRRHRARTTGRGSRDSKSSFVAGQDELRSRSDHVRHRADGTSLFKDTPDKTDELPVLPKLGNRSRNLGASRRSRRRDQKSLITSGRPSLVASAASRRLAMVL